MIHIGEKPYKCDICNSSYIRKQSLDRHKTIHNGDITKHYKFADSQRSFSNCKTRRGLGEPSNPDGNLCAIKLEEETVQVNTVTSYSCDKCCATYDGLASYEVHLETHHRRPMKNNGRELCFDETVCENSMSSVEATTTEESSENETDNRSPTSKMNANRTESRILKSTMRYKCNVCRSKFLLKSHLTRHKKGHTLEKCNKYGDTSSFTSESPLNMSDTGEKPYKCEVCNLGFTQKGSLKVHKKIHTGRKSYKCEICTASFTQKGSLTRHTMIHKGEKPYKCDICMSSFTHKNYLNKHKMIHTGEKPYKCGICPSSFTHKNYLNKHKATHTGEQPYRCDICTLTFARKYNLKLHIMHHTGEKPYKCDICISSFTQKSDLRVHKISHTGEKSYKCESCCSSFTHKSNLNKHKKTHRKFKTEDSI